MIDTVVTVVGWVAVAFMAVVTILLAMGKQRGLKLIQHDTAYLPQALLVRYASLTLLALLAAWINAPRLLFGLLLSFAVIGFGDAFVYSRAGKPYWIHLISGGGAAIGALLSLFAML